MNNQKSDVSASVPPLTPEQQSSELAESELEKIERETSKFLRHIFRMGFKKDFKIVVYSSLPIILSNFSQTFLPIISLFFCGHIGPNELAAATLGGTFVNIVAYASLIGLASACDTLFPQLFTGEDKTKLGLVLQKGLIISAIASLPAVSLLINIKYVMFNFIEEKQVAILADEYILYLLPSVFFYSLNCIIIKYVLCQDIFYPILAINLSANIVNATLHYILIFLLNMGLKGGAISVSITNGYITLITLAYIYFNKIYISTWPGWAIESLEEWRLYLRLAIPGMAMIFLEWSNFEIGILTAGTLGKTELSTMAICVQTIYIAFMVPLGIATATNIRVGHLLGQNKPQSAKNAAKVAFSINFTLTMVSFMLLIVGSRFIPMAFTSDKKIIGSASNVIKFLSLVHLFDSIQGFFSNILKSVGGQLYGSIAVAISFYMNGLPLGVYLMKKTNMGIFGFWVGFLSSGVVLVTLQMIYVFRIDWIKIAKEAHERTLRKKELHPTLSGDYIDVPEVERKKLLLRRKTIKFKIMVISILVIIFITVASVRFAIETETHALKLARANLTNITLPFLAQDRIIPHVPPKTT